MRYDLQSAKKKTLARFLVIAAVAAFTAVVPSGVTRAAETDGQDEAALIKTLRSDVSAHEKEKACRRLKRIGTPECVPAVGALLDDAKLSHMARWALESMPYAEADKALRDGLEETEGRLKVGVINSIGVRKDAKAVDQLIPLLEDPDAEVAGAAARALGDIATEPAVEALADFRAEADGDLEVAAADGSLRAAQELTARGQNDVAAAICRDLRDEKWPGHIRVAAWVGLVKALPADEAAARLTEALSGDDAMLRGQAARLLGRDVGTDIVEEVVAGMDELPPAGQVRVLEALAVRTDIAGRSTALDALESDSTAVRLAALDLLVGTGTPEDVSDVAAMLDSDDEQVAKAARTTLTDMEADGVNGALVDALDEVPASARTALVGVLVDRRAEEGVPRMVDMLDSSDADVRMAALQGLGVLGGADEDEAVVDALTSAGNDDERAAAEKALLAICRREGMAAFSAVTDGMEGAGDAAKASLLHALGAIGSGRALSAVKETIADEEGAVRDEAVRVLASWQDVSAASALLQIAESSPQANYRILALRGYVRLAGKASVQQRTEMLRKAEELAERTQEKKLIISAWGDTVAPASLDALVEWMDNASVKTEAAAAAVNVAEKLAPKNKPAIRRAMQAVLDKVENKTFRTRAQKVLKSISK